MIGAPRLRGDSEFKALEFSLPNEGVHGVCCKGDAGLGRVLVSIALSLFFWLYLIVMKADWACTSAMPPLNVIPCSYTTRHLISIMLDIAYEIMTYVAGNSLFQWTSRLNGFLFSDSISVTSWSSLTISIHLDRLSMMWIESFYYTYY